MKKNICICLILVLTVIFVMPVFASDISVPIDYESMTNEELLALIDKVSAVLQSRGYSITADKASDQVEGDSLGEKRSDSEKLEDGSESVSALSENVTVSLEEIYDGQACMANGKAFMATKFGKWVLMDGNGQEVNGDLYESLYIDSDDDGSWFMVGDMEKHKGILWEDGRLILPCKYDDVECYNENWSAGKDNAASKIDVCYQGTIVASIDSALVEKYNYAKPHGDYLYFSGTSGVLSVVSVDKNGTVRQKEYVSSYDEYHYDSTNKCYYHAGSDQNAFTESCTLKPEEVDCAFLLDGRYILDLQGNLIAKLPEGVSISAVKGIPFQQYIEIVKDGEKGLIDNQGNIVLEPIYDEVPDRPNMFGLFAVKKDDEVMFVDKNGGIRQRINYAGRLGNVSGWYSDSPFLVFDGVGSKTVFTATSGILSQFFVGDYFFSNINANPVVSVSYGSSDGYQYGLMDVYGNMLIPFSQERIEVNRQGNLVQVGRKIYRIDISNQ